MAEARIPALARSMKTAKTTVRNRFPSGTNSAALESPTNRLTTCRVHRQAVSGSKQPPKLVGWTVFFPVEI